MNHALFAVRLLQAVEQPQQRQQAANYLAKELNVPAAKIEAVLAKGTGKISNAMPKSQANTMATLCQRAGLQVEVFPIEGSERLAPAVKKRNAPSRRRHPTVADAMGDAAPNPAAPSAADTPAANTTSAQTPLSAKPATSDANRSDRRARANPSPDAAAALCCQADTTKTPATATEADARATTARSSRTTRSANSPPTLSDQTQTAPNLPPVAASRRLPLALQQLQPLAKDPYILSISGMPIALLLMLLAYVVLNPGVQLLGMPLRLRSLINFISLAIAGIVLTAALLLIYQAWRAIFDSRSPLSPRYCVLLAALPLVNVVGLFQVIGRYPAALQGFSQRHGLETPPLSKALFWLCPLLLWSAPLLDHFLLARLLRRPLPISYLGFSSLVALVVLTLVVSQTCDAVNALVLARDRLLAQAKKAGATEVPPKAPTTPAEKITGS